MNVCAPLFLYSSMLVNLYIFTCIKSQGGVDAIHAAVGQAGSIVAPWSGGSTQGDVVQRTEGDFESSLAAELTAQGFVLPRSSVEPVHGVIRRMRPRATASTEPSPTSLALVSQAVVPKRAVPPTPPEQRIMDGMLNDLHLSLAALESQQTVQQPEPDQESAEVSKDVAGANEMSSIAPSQAGEATQTAAGEDNTNQSDEVAGAHAVQMGDHKYKPLSMFMKKKRSHSTAAATDEDKTSAPPEGGASHCSTALPPCWNCKWADVDPDKDACPQCNTLVCFDCMDQGEGGCPQCGFGKPPTPPPTPSAASATPGLATPAASADAQEVVPLSPQNRAGRARGRGRGGRAKRGEEGGGAQQPPKRPRSASATAKGKDDGTPSKRKAKAHKTSDGGVAEADGEPVSKKSDSD